MEIIEINVTCFIVQNIVEMMLTHLKTKKRNMESLYFNLFSC